MTRAKLGNRMHGLSTDSTPLPTGFDRYVAPWPLVMVAKFGKFYFLKSITNGAQQCAFHGLSSILIHKNTYMKIHIKVS